MRVNVVGKKAVRVNDKGKTTRRLDPEVVARGLGATRSSLDLVSSQSPFSLMAVRREIVRRLESTGGRPGLAGTDRRQKIPLQESDWRELERIAGALREYDVNATAGQVASTILHSALSGWLQDTTSESRTRLVDVDRHSRPDCRLRERREAA